jgi:hypothetical protein
LGCQIRKGFPDQLRAMKLLLMESAPKFTEAAKVNNLKTRDALMTNNEILVGDK